MGRTTDELIDKKYTHISRRNIPFEDTIIEVYAKAGVEFSKRYEFLHTLYFVTSKGYYFKYSDLIEPIAYNDANEDYPFQQFLNGILDAAWVLAYHSNPDDIIRFIKRNLESGMLHCRKVQKGVHAGKFYFLWTLPWYSYLWPEEREN